MPKSTPSYICEECGRTFKAQGIGPHQRTMKHTGKRLVHENARPLTNVVETTSRPVEKAVEKRLPVKPHSRPSEILRLRVMPYIVVQDENGRHGLLQWEEENGA